jgi:hypothetical protein
MSYHYIAPILLYETYVKGICYDRINFSVHQCRMSGY